MMDDLVSVLPSPVCACVRIYIYKRIYIYNPTHPESLTKSPVGCWCGSWWGGGGGIRTFLPPVSSVSFKKYIYIQNVEEAGSKHIKGSK